MRITATWAGIGVLGITCLAAGVGAQPVPAVGPVPATATPAAPANPAPAASIPALIADLGSPNFRTRERAGAALADLGDRALPQLRKALGETTSPEVSRRLTVLVRKLDLERLISPKRVSLALKGKPVKEVLEEIARQTGYRIEYGGGPDTKYSFEFENLPFWQAMDRVASAAGLNIQPESYGNDDAIHVYSQDILNPYVAYAGPFRFVAQNISMNRNITLAGMPRQGQAGRGNESLGLSFQIHSEPKNPILGTMQPVLTVAVDDAGVSMIPPGAPGSFRSNYFQPSYGRQHSAYGNINLVRGDRSATTIKSLKGKVIVVMLGAVIPEVTVVDPLKVKNKTFTGRTMQVEFGSLTTVNGQYTASLTITRRAGDNNRPDYNWSNSLWQRVELVDDRGEKYRNFGPENITNNNGTSVRMTVRFGPENRRGQVVKMNPPVRLTVNEWQAATHEVSFEFKNIPLP